MKYSEFVDLIIDIEGRAARKYEELCKKGSLTTKESFIDYGVAVSKKRMCKEILNVSRTLGRAGSFSVEAVVEWIMNGSSYRGNELKACKEILEVIKARVKNEREEISATGDTYYFCPGCGLFYGDENTDGTHTDDGCIEDCGECGTELVSMTRAEIVSRLLSEKERKI